MRVIEGSTRSGKTYFAVGLIEQYVRESVYVYTNIELVGFSGLVTVLDRDTVKAWKNGHSGPWALEGIRPGSVLVLDECHNFVDKRMTKTWTEWSKETAHFGWLDVILITPSWNDLEKGLRSCVSERLCVTGAGELRDKVFGVCFGDLCELLAAWLRKTVRFARLEYKQLHGYRWKVERYEYFFFDGGRFDRYRSFAPPVTEVGGKVATQTYEIKGRIEATRIFFQRNMGRIAVRLSVYFFVCFVIYTVYRATVSFAYKFGKKDQVAASASAKPLEYKKIYVQPDPSPTPAPTRKVPGLLYRDEKKEDRAALAPVRETEYLAAVWLPSLAADEVLSSPLMVRSSARDLVGILGGFSYLRDNFEVRLDGYGDLAVLTRKVLKKRGVYVFEGSVELEAFESYQSILKGEVIDDDFAFDD